MRGLVLAFLAFDFTGAAGGSDGARSLSSKTAAKTTVKTV